MIREVLNLAQVLITLLLVVFNCHDINISGQSIEKLAFLIFLQVKNFFPKPARGLVRLTWLANLDTTTTILIKSRGIRGLLNFGVFLILELSSYCSIVMKIVSITFLSLEKGLAIYLCINIFSLLNSLWLIGYIPIFFVQLGPNWGSQAIPKISNEKVIKKSGNSIKLIYNSLQVL